MKTVEVKVLDGTVYTLKESLSVGDAIEYLKTYVAKDETAIDDIGKVLDDATPKKKTFGSMVAVTCSKMEDVEWLTKHVIIKPSGVMQLEVPLHHAWQLIDPMRKAVRFEELMDVVKAMQQPPDPDFPEDESKN